MSTGVFFFFNDFNTNYFEKKASLEDSTKLIEWIYAQWKNGDFENNLSEQKLVCSQFPKKDQVDQDFYKCNPEYIDCLIKSRMDNGKKFVFEKSTFEFLLKEGKIYKPIQKVKLADQTLNQVYSVQFKNNDNDLFSVYLTDSCRDLYLKQDRYAEGEYKSDVDDWMWSNQNRFLFIDKYPIRSYLYKLWIEHQKSFNPQDFLTFQENMSVEEYEKFCSLHGGKIISSHVLDASSFFPTLREADVKNYYRSSYFWKKAQTLDDENALAPKCSTFFTKECLKSEKFSIKSIQTPSWSGLLHVQGGLGELVKNKRERNLSFFPSSFYFDKEEVAHFLGSRMTFEELKKVNENFRYSTRCMIERSYEEI